MGTTIFAHRGASMYAPENTLPAFTLAVQMGAEGIETDVQLTKDHIPVLIHDEKINRTTNGKGFVKDFTFKQLKQLDAGSWFSNTYKNASLLSLTEFLRWAKSHSLSLNIELKNNRIDYPHLEAIVFERVKHYEMLDRTIVSSFNPKSILRLKPFRDQMEVAFLVKRRTRRLLKQTKYLKAHALHIKYNALHKSLIQQAKRENILLRVYTVNRARQLLRCFRRECAGIFTDVPDIAIQKRTLFLGGST